MAHVMEMLALSPTMEEGTLAGWLKEEGDSIEEGDILAEVETDKATMELESFYSGTVLKLLAEPGDAIRVGAPLAIIGEEGEDISDLLEGGEQAAPAEAAEVAEQEPAAEEEEAPAAKPAAAAEDGRRLKVSPLARRMAEEKGLDLSTLEGSGPGGRIIKRDVEQAKAAPAAKPAAATRRAPSELVGVDVSYVPGQAEPLSQMRKTIARRLGEVWQTTPHFYLTKEIDMGPAMARRKEINDQLVAADAGFKISVNDMIIKACALAIADYPAMNVAFLGEEVYHFDEINIGVAVAVDEGLITPTIKSADKKSLGSIAKEIRELAGRARDMRLMPEEYSSHTLSVTNLGMYGIDEFMAVINAPDPAILACGAVKKVPVVVDDELTIGTRMKVSLACDHRVIDGAVGAEFLQVLQRYLENPMMLII